MKTAIQELIEELKEVSIKHENNPFFSALGIAIDKAKYKLEKEKEQLCDFYIRGRNEKHLDYYPEKHAKEEYDLIFNKKENGQD